MNGKHSKHTLSLYMGQLLKVIQKLQLVQNAGALNSCNIISLVVSFNTTTLSCIDPSMFLSVVQDAVGYLQDLHSTRLDYLQDCLSILISANSMRSDLIA